MPVFNAERYLGEALDSILSQTYSDFELIVSDNASVDRTAEICKEYAARDQRIRYYRNEKNQGAAPNYNHTFKLSRGEYFKWAPYDDLINPTFLSECVQVLDQRTTVVLCYTRTTIIDDRGDYVSDYDPGPATALPTACERFRNLILWPEYAVQQMGLIRSDALRQTALHQSFPSSDEVLLAELALFGEFYEIPQRLYSYRRHAKQSTQGRRRSRVTFFDTSLADSIVLPTWRYCLAAVSVVRKRPLTGCDRSLCYWAVARWCLMPSHFRALGKDVVLAFTALVCIVLFKIKRRVTEVGKQLSRSLRELSNRTETLPKRAHGSSNSDKNRR
ncbi:MAG: glycosyltransferase [Acidobacteriota bacterium]